MKQPQVCTRKKGLAPLRKKIAINQLQVGMHVELPLAWYEHTFLTNKFTIGSKEQIIKIKLLGLKEITIDTDKGIDVPDELKSVATQAQTAIEAAEQIIPDSLMEALHDKHMPAPEKAAVVHEQAVVMMERLLANPTAENIKMVKKGVGELVNLILTDDDTTRHLLLITSHDSYTFTHSVSVGVLGIALSKFFFKKTNRHNLAELGSGFFLHDLGKVLIDQQILLKPGKLTEQEMQEVRRHPALGFRLLHETRQSTEECKLILLQHHERKNGTGYPKGLEGDAIHIYGRICTIADVYDALTSDRPYRKKMTPFAALKLMQDEMLDHFQRDLFEQFVKMFAHTS